MALPSDIKKAVQALDKKIKDLEDTKRRLIEAFGGSMLVSGPEKTNGNRPHPTAIPATAGLTINASSAEKLAMFLRSNGPATRKEITERSGVPSGSISYLLKNGGFRQREDEKWEVVA